MLHFWRLGFCQGWLGWNAKVFGSHAHLTAAIKANCNDSFCWERVGSLQSDITIWYYSDIKPSPSLTWCHSLRSPTRPTWTGSKSVEETRRRPRNVWTATVATVESPTKPRAWITTQVHISPSLSWFRGLCLPSGRLWVSYETSSIQPPDLTFNQVFFACSYLGSEYISPTEVRLFCLKESPAQLLNSRAEVMRKCGYSLEHQSYNSQYLFLTIHQRWRLWRLKKHKQWDQQKTSSSHQKGYCSTLHNPPWNITCQLLTAAASFNLVSTSLPWSGRITGLEPRNLHEDLHGNKIMNHVSWSRDSIRLAGFSWF